MADKRETGSGESKDGKHMREVAKKPRGMMTETLTRQPGTLLYVPGMGERGLL
jgi:hypothetical protein